MERTPQRLLWKILPFVYFGLNIGGWVWLYAQFLRRYYYTPNPFFVSLSLLQWMPGLAAAILVLGAVRGSRGSARMAWFWLGLALALWPLSDAILQLPPAGFSSVLAALSRSLHLLAFAFALAAVFFFAPVPRARFGRLRFLLDLAINAATWGLLLWFLVVEPVLQPSLAASDSGIWMALYALLDLEVLMLITWLQGQARRPQRHLWPLTAGFFLLALNDLVSGWIALQGEPQAFLWTGFLMVGGYALIALAPGFRSGRDVEPENIPADERGLAGWPRLRMRWQRVEARWLPLASTIALVVFMLAQWRRSGAPDPLLAVLVVALSLLLFLREGVIAGQAEAAGYALLLENVDDPAFLCTGEGALTLENSSMRKLHSYPSAGRAVAGLLPARPAWDFLLREARAGGWRGEVIVESSARGSFPAWLVLQPLPRETDGSETFAALLHDLSPQRRQEESLRAAYRQAEDSRRALEHLSGRLEDAVREKTADLSRALATLEEQNRLLRSLDRMKSEFVALTSHELRTPLAGIRAGLELLLSRKSPLPKDTRENLNLVQKESDRLTRFVESILDLTALEAGRLPLQLGPLRLAESMDAARDALAAAHGGRESRNLRRLQISIPADLPEVRADGHILASVFFQIIDNAFKYAPEGPVEVAAQRNETCADVLFRDRGPGIPEEQRGRLFLMFSRLEDSDSPRVRGVGLGLYISRKMVEAMDGSLEALPAEGGLALRLRLPLFTGET